ncbi:MAG: LD-carboxypeptidase [Chitinophagales bacterium]
MLNSMLLKKGETLGILSTARWQEEEELKLSNDFFREWGLKTVYGKTIKARHDQFAGDDDLRTSDLQQFLDDPSISAIICSRGGYGTIRIIDKIDFTAFVQRPKFICGFSDITVLHTHISDKLGISTIHSTMPICFSSNSTESIQTLKNVLFGLPNPYEIPAHPLNKTGEAEGILAGGNLSILYSLLGTRFGFSTSGKILFLEDVDEYLYHIDRMMMSLKLAGKLENIKGLIVGGMTEMKDNLVKFGKSAQEIISEHVTNLNIPVCFGFPAGHQDDNRALYMGSKTKMRVGSDGVKILQE